MTYKFTPSQIGLLDECPRCFWLDHKKGIKRPRGIFPSLPSGMDKILKNHFDEYRKKGELPPELKELKGVKLFEDKELLDKWRSNWKGMKYETDKYILKGAIDALLVKGKKLIVLDYKTRGYPLKEDTHIHYINQQSMYNFILRKLGYETEDYSYLLFYHPDKIMEEVFLFHKDLIKIKTSVKKIEKLVQKALKVLKGPIPNSAKDCEYCQYRNVKVDSTLLDY